MLSFFGYVEQRIELKADQDREQHVVLVKQAKLRVRSRPPGAVIYDTQGKARGITPSFVYAPPDQEPLELVLKREGYADEVVEIIPDEDKSVTISMTPLVTVHIESEPPGAEVWRSGRRIGITPFNDEIPRSNSEIAYRLTMEGFASEEIRLQPRHHRKKRIRLRKLAP